MQWYGSFCLEICRNGDESMNPAIRAGDLVIYDRLAQEYHTGDVVVIKQDGGRQYSEEWQQCLAMWWM